MLFRAFDRLLNICSVRVLSDELVLTTRSMFSQVFSAFDHGFNPVIYGGGGLFGPDHQIIDNNSII